MNKENSFMAGFKGGIGLIAALFFVFVIAPCAVCSGLAVCGGAVGSMDDYRERAEEAGTTAGGASAAADPAADPAAEEGASADGEDPAPTGKWRVREAASDMDDSSSIYLTLGSENRIADWIGRRHQGQLVVRCVENQTSAILRTGMNANPEVGNFQKAHARIRLDDKAADRVNLSESTSGEALFFPGSTKFPRQFSGHKRLRFEFTPFQQGSKIYEFDLTGYDEVLPKVQEACGWE